MFQLTSITCSKWFQTVLELAFLFHSFIQFGDNKYGSYLSYLFQNSCIFHELLGVLGYVFYVGRYPEAHGWQLSNFLYESNQAWGIINFHQFILGETNDWISFPQTTMQNFNVFWFSYFVAYLDFNVQI